MQNEVRRVALAAAEPLEARRLLAADPVITEFLAQNTSNRTDEDGKFSDWIEIHNPDPAAALDLAAYYLTDDATNPTQWQFPAGVTLAPGAYLLVWASGEDRRAASGPLHTNFSLKAEGEYLGLVKPDGQTVASAYAPAFPAQRQNVSYGVAPGGNRSFFNTPTPAAANNGNVSASVAAPVFSQPRGFYDHPFSLTIRSDTPGASIRYTTDGSAPTASSGTVYNGPITVSTTENIRAVAYTNGSAASAVVTQSYIFLDDVVRQPASVPGFPGAGSTRTVENGARLPADTQMDPNVVNDPAYAGQIRGALTSIPTLVLTAPTSTIFGGQGFHDASGDDGPEQPVSVELIDPARPQDNSGVTAAAEPQSNAFLKRSIRLSFKPEFGPTEWRTDLLKNAPLNGDSASGELDSLVLRGGKNRSWAYTTGASSYVEDQWYRDTQIAVSGYGSHGTFVHLYLNGVYWGLYNIAERPDEGWQAETFGGQDDDYFSVRNGGRRRGDGSRWDYLIGDLTDKDLSNSANYNELKRYLDVEDYAEYLLVNWFQGTTDWPNNNWFGGYRTTGGTNSPTPFRYFAWDGEYSWDRENGVDIDVNGAAIPPAFTRDTNDVESRSINVGIFNALRENSDFMTLLADRAYALTRPGAPLSTESALARFDALTDYIDDAMIGESARWGDAFEPVNGKTLTRDRDWRAEVRTIRSLIQGNDTQLIGALRTADFYPTVNPPTMNQRGGPVAPGFDLTLANPNSGGTIYYTTDGSDPRLPGGGISPRAAVYEGPVNLDASATVRARVRSGDTWSAQDAAAFEVSPFSALRVTELMYNPAPANPPGSIDGDEFEFIRLRNTGDTPLNLAGVRLHGGIGFTFAGGTIAPGETITLAENPDAFAARYGTGVAIAGRYTGKLDDEGEAVRLLDPQGNAILDFTYDDAWYPTTDGQGYSLVILNPSASPTSWGAKESWGPSAAVGGTIGTPNPTPPPVPVPDPTPGPENQSPAVTVTGPASVTVAETATVSAAVTDDGLPAGGTVSVAWSLVSGPDDVTFAAPAAASTGVTFAAPGTYVLRATATDGALSRAADLTVTAAAVAAPPPEPVPVTNIVTGLVLVDAKTGQDLMPLRDGDTINLAALPTKRLTVRAELAGEETASVRFGYDAKPGRFKPIYRIETGRPATLFGSRKGKLKKGPMSKGAHVIQAAGFTGPDGSGSQGPTLAVRFTVVNDRVGQAAGTRPRR